mmetsp:Transcript_865/g.1167  ORF Transcript_865/g.1167 Transcript_865/m.1167 type:complete len:88 (+) Transcript_865:412-675(+)
MLQYQTQAHGHLANQSSTISIDYGCTNGNLATNNPQAAYFNKSTFEAERNQADENSSKDKHYQSYKMTPSELQRGRQESLLGSTSQE